MSELDKTAMPWDIYLCTPKHAVYLTCLRITLLILIFTPVFVAVGHSLTFVAPENVCIYKQT